MRAESVMWKKLRAHLLFAKLDPIRVENPIHPGTPDVNHLYGWLELKTIACWPSCTNSKVLLHWYTPQQRVFLYRRWRAAPGSTHLLLEVRAAAQWLLFDGDYAARSVGRVPRQELEVNARVVLSANQVGQLPNYLRPKPSYGDAVERTERLL
jgi:hypothetical protein